MHLNEPLHYNMYLIHDDLHIPVDDYVLPLDLPHCAVTNAITFQLYRVKFQYEVQRDGLECRAYVDVFRRNVVYITGDLCPISMSHVMVCWCAACENFRNPARISSYVSSQSSAQSSETYVRVLEVHFAGVTFDLRNKCPDPTTSTQSILAMHAIPARMIISDSGATKHMFRDRAVFSQYKTVTGVSVRMAGGSLEPVLGIGSVGPLTGVLHVHHLVFDLVSEPMLAELGMRGMWQDAWKTVHTRDGTLFYTAQLNVHKLYEIDPVYFGLRNIHHTSAIHNAHISKVEAIDILHKTFGHVSVGRLQSGVETGHIQWTHPSLPNNFRKLSAPCVVCALAKSKRRVFAGPIRSAHTPGTHWYMDVWGPADTPAMITENKYMVGFVDAATKML